MPVSSMKFARGSRQKIIAATVRDTVTPSAKAAVKICAAVPIVMAASLAAAVAAPAWPASFEGRLEALALIETLNANLLASRSATETLTEWCAAHHMAEPPKLVAHLQRDVAKPISPEQRRALDIGPNEPVVYRRVDLACGSHVLSRADNWYVPSRLTPAMNAALVSSDIPFGRVVGPLHPRRQTLSVKMLWQALPQGWEMRPVPADDPAQKLVVPALLFEHRAVVYAANGQPISEVDENYTSEILDFRPEAPR